MSLDASDFPTEGQNLNSDTLLPSVDYLMGNIGRVQRKIGARAPHPIPNGMPPSEMYNHSVGMPNNTVPEKPKSLRLPEAKMMPGADTKPGTAVSETDMKAFKQTVASNMIPASAYNANTPMSVLQAQVYAPHKPAITYFKDALGNEYKTIDDELYFLGWQNTDLKIRIINDKNGKVQNCDGKKFQIYGWHLVKKNTNSDDIKKNEKETNVDSVVDVLTDGNKGKPFDAKKNATDEQVKSSESSTATVKVTEEKTETEISPKKKGRKLL